jgi:hypothetical protein
MTGFFNVTPQSFTDKFAIIFSFLVYFPTKVKGIIPLRIPKAEPLVGSGVKPHKADSLKQNVVLRHSPR